MVTHLLCNYMSRLDLNKLEGEAKEVVGLVRVEQAVPRRRGDFLSVLLTGDRPHASSTHLCI